MPACYVVVSSAPASSAIELCANTSSSSYHLPLLGMQPVAMYVAQLTHLFGSIAYFYYDVYGSDTILFQWKADFKQQLSSINKWSVKHAHYAAPCTVSPIIRQLDSCRLLVADAVVCVCVAE